MNDNTINVEDLVLPELPNIKQDVGTTVPTPVINKDNSEMSLFMEKTIISFSLTIIFIVIFLVLFLILKRKKQNTIQSYETKHKKKRKSKQKKSKDYENILGTPENIKDCIRLFLERTK